MTTRRKPQASKRERQRLTPHSTQAEVHAAEARGRARMAATAKREAEANAAPGWKRLAADLDEAIAAIARADVRRDEADAWD